MVVTHTQLANTWSSLSEEEEMALLKFSLDTSNPSDDMWRKFALPLTPPCSPSRSFGESSDCDELTSDITDLERLHDVSESLDSTFDICSNSCSRAIDHLQSKLISDCMWSGNHDNEPLVRPVYFSKVEYSKKFTIEPEELYPTPCPSPSPSSSDASDYTSSNDCVDPTSVFPFPLSNVNDSISSQSDSDEEIDVVTVDTKPLTIDVGRIDGRPPKRKFGHLNKPSIIYAKIQTTPTLRKSKSLPPKLSSSSSSLRQLSITTNNSNSSAEDSDPEMRRVNRVNHNVLERKRRIDLKKSFERLKECVPGIEVKDRAPKVIVLKKASEYVLSLTKQEADLFKQRELLQKQNDMLQLKLEQCLQNPLKF